MVEAVLGSDPTRKEEAVQGYKSPANHRSEAVLGFYALQDELARDGEGDVKGGFRGPEGPLLAKRPEIKAHFQLSSALPLFLLLHQYSLALAPSPRSKIATRSRICHFEQNQCLL